jgi:uncharacterized protein YqhQ
VKVNVFEVNVCVVIVNSVVEVIESSENGDENVNVSHNRICDENHGENRDEKSGETNENCGGGYVFV